MKFFYGRSRTLAERDPEDATKGSIRRTFIMGKRRWAVYIIRCRDGRLYTGISNNVERRVATHNKGKGCRFTKCRYPVKLVYQEECMTKSAARKRELQIQGFTRDRKLGLIGKRSFGASGARLRSLH